MSQESYARIFNSRDRNGTRTHENFLNTEELDAAKVFHTIVVGMLLWPVLGRSMTDQIFLKKWNRTAELAYRRDENL
jgi:hypothetical protein